MRAAHADKDREADDRIFPGWVIRRDKQAHPDCNWCGQGLATLGGMAKSPNLNRVADPL